MGGPLGGLSRVSARGGVSRGELAAAAASGAIAAVIVAVLVLFVLPPRRVEDPRAIAISRDLEDLKLQLRGVSDKVHELEAGAVATAASTATLMGTLTDQTATIATLRKDLTALSDASQRQWDDQAGIAAPALLGVAVVQLRTAIDRGLPFDWELVNLWGIAGRRPDAMTELARLTPMAATGVPTPQQIVALLQDMANRVDPPVSLIGNSLITIEWILGAGAGTAAENGALVRRVITVAQRGDYAAAARDLRTIGRDGAAAAEPVIAAMDRRAVAQAATTRLMAMARDGLAAQARATAATH
jgi:hypothetical protein